MTNILKITHSRLYRLSQIHLKAFDKQFLNNKLRKKIFDNRTSLNDRTTKRKLLRTFSQEVTTTIDLFEADQYWRTNFKPNKRLLKKVISNYPEPNKANKQKSIAQQIFNSATRKNFTFHQEPKLSKRETLKTSTTQMTTYLNKNPNKKI